MKLNTNSRLVEEAQMEGCLYDLKVLLALTIDNTELSIEDGSLVGRLMHPAYDPPLYEFTFPIKPEFHGNLELEEGYFVKGPEKGQVITLLRIHEELEFQFAQVCTDVSSCSDVSDAQRIARDSLLEYFSSLEECIDHEVGISINLHPDKEIQRELIKKLCDPKKLKTSEKNPYNGEFNPSYSTPRRDIPEDMVWNKITNSAKTRFDYDSFNEAFDDFGNDNISENILFMIVAGYAEEKSSNELAEQINNELLPLGCMFSDDDLQDLLLNKSSELKSEILATSLAANLLNQGRQVPEILVQVDRILAEPK